MCYGFKPPYMTPGVSPCIQFSFRKNVKNDPKSCIIAFNFGQFFTFLDPKIKIAEMVPMDPNTPRESIWVGQTIQYTFKLSICPFTTCIDFINSRLPRTFMATYNDPNNKIWPWDVTPSISRLFDTGSRNLWNWPKSVYYSLQFCQFWLFFLAGNKNCRKATYRP